MVIYIALPKLFTPQPFEVELTAKNNSVKAAQFTQTSPKPIGEIEHVTLTLSYKNNTDKDIAGVQAWLNVPGQTNFGFANTNTTKFNLLLSKANKGYIVYDLPVASAGAITKATIPFWNRQVGRAEIHAIFKAEDRINVKAKPIIINVQ